MGKTYRRDSERKFKNFSKGKSKPNKLKHVQDEPKFKKYIKSYTEDGDNEY